MEDKELIKQISQRLYRELTFPFIDAKGSLNESAIENHFSNRINTTESGDTLYVEILKLRAEIKNHNTGLSLIFDKVEEGIQKLVETRVSQIGSEAIIPFDLNKLNSLITDLKQHIQTNGIDFLKKIETEIATPENLEKIKILLRLEQSKFSQNIPEWNSKIDVITKNGKLQKDIVAEIFKFNTNVLNIISRCIDSLRNTFSSMYYELDGFYYDNNGGIEAAFILRYTNTFKQIIEELNRTQAKADEYKFEKEYERLLSRDFRQKLSSQVGLLYLLEYLEGRKNKQIKYVIKGKKWNDFIHICQGLAKEEFYKDGDLARPLISYDKEKDEYSWLGIKQSKVPPLGSFINILREKGFLTNSSKSQDVSYAFASFFDLLYLKDIKFIGKSASLTNPQYDRDIKLVIENILSLP